jgi:transposase
MDTTESPGRFELRNDQWDRIEHLLPGRPGHVGANGHDNRKFVNAVLYRYRAGIPWRDLPAYYGDFRVIHKRHMRWSRKGVWEKVFKTLASDADNEWAEIDATIVRAHQHSAGGKKGAPEQEAIGRSAGGLSTKIHATTDALGNPTGFHLTPGQASDLDGADVLLPQVEADTVIGDKGYDAQERVIELLEKAGKTPVIPSKKNAKNPRDYDKYLYKARHLIENFFAKMKQYRAIATRYDKLSISFLGAIYLVAAAIWLI